MASITAIKFIRPYTTFIKPKLGYIPSVREIKKQMTPLYTQNDYVQCFNYVGEKLLKTIDNIKHRRSDVLFDTEKSNDDSYIYKNDTLFQEVVSDINKQLLDKDWKLKITIYTDTCDMPYRTVVSLKMLD